jgi:hypothetical protein
VAWACAEIGLDIVGIPRTIERRLGSARFKITISQREFISKSHTHTYDWDHLFQKSEWRVFRADFIQSRLSYKKGTESKSIDIQGPSSNFEL